MKIISWNVNGIRAAERKGLYDFFDQEQAEIYCLQETKAHPDQLQEIFLNRRPYHSYWSSAEKKGYSGVAVYSKLEPLHVREVDEKNFQREGRALIIEYPQFTLINAYFPNSQEGGKRLSYKLAFCSYILDFCLSLEKDHQSFLLCGDFNIAHKAIDLARPEDNENNPGYLPEERTWMDRFIDSGFIDTFRVFHKEPDCYTWWSYRTRARERNIGWRLDYHCTNKRLMASVQDSEILHQISGSDHCPIRLSLQL